MRAEMLSPDDAEKTMLAQISVLPAEDCPLAQAGGRVLRAAIVADRDLPPYDRVTADGFAIRLGRDANGGARAHAHARAREFRVTGTQAAGMIPLVIDGADACVEVAAGAALPSGADTVVPHEDAVAVYDEAREVCEAPAADAGGKQRRMRLAEGCAVEAGQFVRRRGSDHGAGAVVVPAGVRLGAREIGVAAACGCASVRVSMQPRVAVVATGDELVEVSNPSPAPHQARRSGDHALRAALLGAGCARVDCEHVRDVEHEMEARLKAIIAEHDAVVIMGGVSKGRFDFVPAVLAKLGVGKKFHGVAQRPGRAFWFGMSRRHTPVFALSGNPFSACVCFHRLVLPALGRMTGAAVAPGAARFAVLAEAFVQRSALTVFVPARVVEAGDGRRVAHVSPSSASGDFAGLAGTDGFVEIGPGPRVCEAGAAARFFAW